MDKIDVHVHVFDLPSERFPRELSGLAPADRACPIEALLADMDASGINRTVLIEMNGTQIEQHAYVTHCVRTWPDRFTATGLIDMNDPDPPARLRELVAATGIEGIRLGALGDPAAQRAEDLSTYAIFECADELGININIYTGGAQFPLHRTAGRGLSRREHFHRSSRRDANHARRPGPVGSSPL